MTPDHAQLLCRALTARELEILQATAAGHTATQIGHHLGISHRTVERHRANIYATLRVHNRIQALRIAHDAGLIRL